MGGASRGKRHVSDVKFDRLAVLHQGRSGSAWLPCFARDIPRLHQCVVTRTHTSLTPQRKLRNTVCTVSHNAVPYQGVFRLYGVCSLFTITIHIRHTVLRVGRRLPAHSRPQFFEFLGHLSGRSSEHGAAAAGLFMFTHARPRYQLPRYSSRTVGVHESTVLCRHFPVYTVGE